MVDTFFDFIFSRWLGIPILFWIGLEIKRRGLDRITFEKMTDLRIDYINDKDILTLWRELTRLNMTIGWWYSKIIGPYFMVMSIILFVMLWLLQWDIPTIWDGKKHIAWFFVVLAVISCWMAFFPASWNPESGDPCPEYAGNYHFGADIELYKEVVYSIYQNIEYQTHLAVYYDKQDKAYRQFHLSYLYFVPNLVKWGLIGWYGFLMGWLFILVLNVLVKNIILLLN